MNIINKQGLQELLTHLQILHDSLNRNDKKRHSNYVNKLRVKFTHNSICYNNN